MEIHRGGWFLYGTTNAADGNARDRAVQDRALKDAAGKRLDLVTCGQVHGDRVAVVKVPIPAEVTATDGLLTGTADLALGILTADCVPVFLFDPGKKVIGLLHAGWKGSVKGIVSRGIERLKEVWGSDPSRILMHCGPHIRKCCYEVGPEVSRLFPAVFVIRREGRATLDLEGTIVTQAKALGLTAGNITQDAACTRCDRRYYSYRRDKSSARMLSFAAKVK